MAKITLYRHFDARGRLLYVGISLNVVARLGAHRDKPWFQDIATVKTKKFPSREAAALAEAQAIKRERPRYNVVHRLKKGEPKPPRPPSILDGFIAEMNAQIRAERDAQRAGEWIQSAF